MYPIKLLSRLLIAGGLLDYIYLFVYLFNLFLTHLVTEFYSRQLKTARIKLITHTQHKPTNNKTLQKNT